MKCLFFVFVFTLFSSFAYTQEYYDLSGVQGLKDKSGDIMFEISGYEISTTEFSNKAEDESVLNSLKAKFKIGTILAEYTDAELSAKNTIIEAEASVTNRPDEKQNQILYIVEKDEGHVIGISFRTTNQRDIGLEQVFVDAYLANRLKEYVSDDWSASKIVFAGQEIQLGYECKWLAPHNVQCGDAQIKWSEFSSYESALLDINNRIRLNSSYRMTIVTESDIDILLENRPTIAHRIVYRQYDSIYENILMVYYYVVQEIDGRYISCMLSNPVVFANDYNLAPLLQQIMSIPELPADAYIPVEEPEWYNDNKSDNDAVLELQLGAWLPVGELSRAFKVAPTVGAFLGFPVSSKISIDVGAQIAVPLDKRQFDFYRNKGSDETKTDLMLNIALRARYKKELSRNLYLNPYLGLGVNILQTGLEKDSYDSDDESTKYESIAAPDLFLGLGFSHKKFGTFIEYHYTPYSVGNKVPGSFGDSSLNIGLKYSFFSL
ncbi:MAG: hypothetical protein ACK5KT_15630 [Dysgonomonas sp.]